MLTPLQRARVYTYAAQTIATGTDLPWTMCTAIAMGMRHYHHSDHHRELWEELFPELYLFQPPTGTQRWWLPNYSQRSQNHRSTILLLCAHIAKTQTR